MEGPHLANMSEASGRESALTLADLQAAGANAVTFQLGSVLAAAHAVRRVYEALRRDGSFAAVRGELLAIDELYEFTGLASFQERENRCAELAERLIGRRKQG